eukprot:3938481-Rhodomonas_salina.1
MTKGVWAYVGGQNKLPPGAETIIVEVYPYKGEVDNCTTGSVCLDLRCACAVRVVLHARWEGVYPCALCREGCVAMSTVPCAVRRPRVCASM